MDNEQRKGGRWVVVEETWVWNRWVVGRKWVVSGWVVGRDQAGAVEGYVSLYAGYVQ